VFQRGSWETPGRKKPRLAGLGYNSVTQSERSPKIAKKFSCNPFNFTEDGFMRFPVNLTIARFSVTADWYLNQIEVPDTGFCAIGTNSDSDEVVIGKTNGVISDPRYVSLVIPVSITADRSESNPVSA